MAWVTRTSSGSYRASWREPSGRQRSKTFKTQRDAKRFIAEIDSSMGRGAYVNPHAGKELFGRHAEGWMKTRRTELTTSARDQSVMRTHVLPRWEAWPLNKIDEMSVQAWVTELAGRRSPAVVSKALQLMSGVMKSAVRNGLIFANPCQDVNPPKIRKHDQDERMISRHDFRTVLLPRIPERYQAVVALAAGTGLRWGEVIGIQDDALDLDSKILRVIRTVVEVSGRSTIKPYPKSAAGRRIVPIPTWVLDILRPHLDNHPAGHEGLRFTTRSGSPLLRGMFRTRVWRPSLVRAGLLGSIRVLDSGQWLGEWETSDGQSMTDVFIRETDAVTAIAKSAGPGLRFHDLRHSYSTWLVDDGVPVNMVQQVLGHERATTTLDLYTRRTKDVDRIRRVLDDDPEPP